MTKDLRDALLDEIYDLAKKDRNLIFITDDMDAFSLKQFREKLPAQYINIGVAEQNMIDVAAGLAAVGKKVFCFGICTYVSTRCFEQIRFSLDSMKLPVVIIGVGTGFSFNFDGPSHQGTGDLGVMRMLPNITIFNPSDDISAAKTTHLAYQNKKGPSYIRLDKGTFPSLYQSSDSFKKGFKIVRPLQKINILTTGIMTHQVLKALESSSKKIGVVDIFKLKPISEELIEILKTSKQVITVEENSIVNGLGTIISELITDNHLPVTLKRLAIKDYQFDIFGSREWFYKLNQLDIKSIQKVVNE